MTNKLADAFNEYGTPVTLFSCPGCKTTFTVCPAVEDDALDQWTGCLGETCSTYDPTRDADKWFDEGRVYRVGDRLVPLRVIEGGGDPNPSTAGTEQAQRGEVTPKSEGAA